MDRENNDSVSSPNNEGNRIKSSEKFLLIQEGDEPGVYKLYLGKYRHYKGELYQVLGVCKHTETEENLVYYQALQGNQESWVRPLKMFFEEVEFKGKIQPRFSFIADR